MSENNQNTWTTTQQNRLTEARRLEENIVHDSHGNQKEFDVAVYENQRDVSLPIFSIPIDLVSYNFDNVRIEKYKKHACSTHDIEELDPTDEVHQGIVQNILLNAQDYSQKSSGNLTTGIGGLIEVGQREPALLTSTGVLWNGNRRCAIMRNLFEQGPTVEIGLLERGKIKVCFLPQMDPEELRNLERRLQQDPDYKQTYGQVTEMAKIQTILNNFDWETDEENATQNEQDAIMQNCKSPNFSTWQKVRNGKKMIDLMDDYLETRNGLHPENLIGYYTLFESTGTTTFFEALRDLLYNQIVPWFTSHPEHGDADEMFDKWREVMFAGLQNNFQKFNETGDKKHLAETYTPVRKMDATFAKASGNVASTTPGDTTHLIIQRMEESQIIQEWDDLPSTEPEDIALLASETREIEGVQVTIGELESDATKRTLKNLEKLGKDPSVLLQDVRDDLRKIVDDDLERVGPNDVHITQFIQECRESLTDLENKNNSAQNETENNL
jgi:hypothetical protein